MTAIVTLRAMKGWRPVLRACMLGAMVVGVSRPGFLARREIAPFASDDFERAILPAAIAACVAAWIGAVMASACWEVRSCTFSWSVPRLLRSMNREMLVGGVVAVVFGAMLGIVVNGGLVDASWSPAIAAALAYAAGASFMMPRGKAAGVIALIAMFMISFALPEIDQAAARFGPFGALVAMAVMVSVILRNFASVAHREGLEARGSWLEAVGPDARLHGRTDRFGTAASPVGDGFHAVRHRDLDWLRALIHEVHGEQRGGLISTAKKWAAVMLFMGAIIHAYLYALREQLPVDFASTFFPVAIVMSMMVVSAPVLPLLGVNRPLSRRRLAWLLWLRTQVEEVAVFGAVMVAFLATAIVADLVVAGDAWKFLGWWAQTLLATFALLPFARWIRLRTIDVDARVARSNGAVISPGYVAGQAAIMFLLLFGSWGTVVGWHELMGRLEAFPPVVTLGAWGGALLVAAACRGWWLLALRRVLERRDLVTA